MAEKRLLRVKDACHYLGVSRMTLLNAEEQGLLTPARTPGGHRRYTVEELEKYLEATRQASAESLARVSTESLLPRFIDCIADEIAGTPEAWLNEALRHLVLLLEADWGVLFLFDEQHTLSLQASFGVPRWVIKEVPPPRRHGVSARAVSGRQPVVYGPAASEVPVTEKVGQGICAPLIYQDDILGVVHVFSAHRRQFFPSEISILSTIAVYLASLVVNSQLIAQYQKRLNELLILNRTAMAMQTQVELDPLLEAFLQEVIATMGADGGAVFLHDPTDGMLYARVMKNLPKEIFQLRLKVGEGITGWVVQHGEPHVSPRLADDPLYDLGSAAHLAEQATSNICLPLKTAGQTLGAFHISTSSPRTFSEEEVRFLVTIGSQAAVIVRRALLLEKASR